MRVEDEFIYVLTGEIILIDDARRASADAGHVRRFQGRRAERPLADQHAQPARHLSRSRHAQRPATAPITPRRTWRR